MLARRIAGGVCCTPWAPWLCTAGWTSATGSKIHGALTRSQKLQRQTSAGLGWQHVPVAKGVCDHRQSQDSLYSVWGFFLPPFDGDNNMWSGPKHKFKVFWDLTWVPHFESKGKQMLLLDHILPWHLCYQSLRRWKSLHETQNLSKEIRNLPKIRIEDSRYQQTWQFC